MFLALALMAIPMQVSVRSLMHEMVDWDRLTFPLPYRHGQASSYDRRSDPGPNSDPFANNDSGQFLRVEHFADHNEYVMADLKGPGVVDRLWSANPEGILRFFFDGEKKPRIKVDMSDFLRGKVLPFSPPFGYEAAQGTNLYFPFPYAKSLKITVDDSFGSHPTGLYYHVGYRTYTPDAPVRTFDQASLDEASSEIRRVADLIENPRTPNGMRLGPINRAVPQHSKSALLNVEGNGIVRELSVRVPLPKGDLKWEDPRQLHNLLRQLLLTITVGGHTCVSTPLGDFFGSAPGLNPYSTLPTSMSKDGLMIMRLPIPYVGGLTATIENIGSVPAALTVSAIVEQNSVAAAPLFTLHAQWTAERGHSRPFKDMNFLTTSGPGNWVGCNLAVANPSNAWWGEGDEKFYVDGETFPSTFGTGTEDFFGYAWGSSQLFDRPFHAQSRDDGPGPMGHTSVLRWQVFDPIPFTKSLRFDLERWHWADVIATYGRTAYWYAPAEAPGPVAIDRSLLLPEEIKPYVVKGALEGESLTISKLTGGITEIQDGFAELSGGKQLWWRDGKVGEQLVLKIPVKKAGTYEVVINAGNARDYGKFTFRLNGQDAGGRDFYLNGLEWHEFSLGKFNLPTGTSTLEITVQSPNPAAEPRNMFGLDYVLLKT